MASLAPVPKFRALDANGNPLAGGKLYTYTAGTTTPRTTFTSDTGLVSNTNPVILDANGEADVWIGNGYYKFVLKDSNDVTQYTTDRISSGTGGEIATSDLVEDTFDANGTDTVFTLSSDPLAEVNCTVVVSGVTQSPNTYAVVGTTLTFSEAPPAGAGSIVVKHGTAMAVGTIADETITAVKIAAGAVTTAKILNVAVTSAKLADSSVTTAKIVDLAVTAGKIADGSITAAKKAALGQQISSLINVSNTAGTFTDTTGLTVTITTTGRPVLLMLIGDNGTTKSAVYAINSTTGNASGELTFIRGSSSVCTFEFIGYPVGGVAADTHPPSAFQYIDLPAAGTYTYKVATRSTNGTGVQIVCQFVKLVAFEL